MRPLEGIRVLDLTRLLPGPYATLMLADLGADVIRVEDVAGEGDFVRWLPPTYSPKDGGEQVGALFLALNRNKRSIALDLKSEQGRETFLRLANKADVVVEGFRPGVMDRLGIGWKVLAERNPRLVMCAMSGYGQEGPLAMRAGHDLGYIALAGPLGVGGPAEGPPSIPGVPISDLAASQIAVSCIVAALLGRERADTRAKGSGRGTYVDVSMYDAAIALMIAHVPGTLAGAPMLREQVGLTGRDPNYRVYRTKDDRWLSVANLEPKFWARFTKTIGRPDLDGAAMGAQIDSAARASLHATLEALFRTKTRDEWTALLESADCCIEPVLEGDEVLAHPHARAREAVIEHEDPRLGRVRMPRTPLRPWSADITPTPAPRNGEHGAAVLAEAGFSAAEIGALRSARVVG